MRLSWSRWLSRGMALLVLALAGCAQGRQGAPSAGTAEGPSTGAAEGASAGAAEGASAGAAEGGRAAPSSAAAAAMRAEEVGKVGSVSFASEVRPLLERRCSPCHFPGGKMYESLPFDSPSTIRALGDKLFTRLKNPQEIAVVRAFLSQPSDQDPPAPSTPEIPPSGGS